MEIREATYILARDMLEELPYLTYPCLEHALEMANAMNVATNFYWYVRSTKSGWCLTNR